MAAVRSISRTIIPITSVSRRVTQKRQLSNLPSTIIAVAATSSRSTSSFLYYTSRTTKLFSTKSTSRSLRSCEIFRNLTMTAASVIIPNKNFSTAMPVSEVEEENVDPIQKQLLEEQCIVLNESDQVIGHDTKRNCHKVVNGDVLLHRAFSVFLFNGNGELLLQQRSKTKITFPLMWTNTCCSHPLHVQSEMVEENTVGVKRAARRRLEVELGIPQDSVSLDEFEYLTRIHYKALSDSVWGEHEIDYILFLQKDGLKIKPNPDEIHDSRWVSLDNLREMVAKENVSLTPWFELILNSRLPEWWQNLKNVKQFEDHDKIHRM